MVLVLIIAIFIFCPVMAIIDLCVMKSQIIPDIFTLIFVPFLAFMFFVYPEIQHKKIEEENAWKKEMAERNSCRAKEKWKQEYERMMNLRELIQSKPTNIGQPRQLTEEDRERDPLMCSEEYFMRKMKYWIPTLRHWCFTNWS